MQRQQLLTTGIGLSLGVVFLFTVYAMLYNHFLFINLITSIFLVVLVLAGTFAMVGLTIYGGIYCINRVGGKMIKVEVDLTNLVRTP